MSWANSEEFDCITLTQFCSLCMQPCGISLLVPTKIRKVSVSPGFNKTKNPHFGYVGFDFAFLIPVSLPEYSMPCPTPSLSVAYPKWFKISMLKLSLHQLFLGPHIIDVCIGLGKC